jgi:hypothetical protein
MRACDAFFFSPVTSRLSEWSRGIYDPVRIRRELPEALPGQPRQFADRGEELPGGDQLQDTGREHDMENEEPH